MKTLVTGGAGFIGSHLVDELVARGDDVVVLDNLRRGRASLVALGARLAEGDIRDGDAVARCVAGAEVVFHLAAQSNVMGAMSDLEYSFTTNVSGTFNVLTSAARAGVRRVVFSSSREVYGEPAALPVTESAPTEPKNPYGASKVAGEAYCRAMGALGGLEVQVLRFANVYGQRDTGRVIPLWVRQALAGEPLELFGGQQVLDFVRVETAVAALLRAAEIEQTGPVNVASGAGTPLPVLAARVRELTGGRAEVRTLPPRGAEVVCFIADPARMRDILGLQPDHDPLSGLEALVEWYRGTGGSPCVAEL